MKEHYNKMFLNHNKMFSKVKNKVNNRNNKDQKDHLQYIYK